MASSTTEHNKLVVPFRKTVCRTLNACKFRTLEPEQQNNHKQLFIISIKIVLPRLVGLGRTKDGK